MTLDTITGTALNFLFMAGMVEGLVEFLIAPFLEPLKKAKILEGQIDWRVQILRMAALAMGLLVSFGFKVNILEFFGVTGGADWMGYLATGFILGRGSNYAHDIVGKWTKS